MKSTVVCTLTLSWILLIHVPLLAAVFTCPEENATHGICECRGNGTLGHVTCRGIESIQDLGEALQNLRCDEDDDDVFFKTPSFRNDSIVSLRLQCSVLTSITSDAFENYHNIVHLDLSHNQIAEIEGTLFVKLTLLEDLNLSDNSLAHINPSWFRPLTKLKSLRLSGNKLQALSGSSFAGLSSLEELDLSRNALSTVDFRLNLTTLKHLDLSNNSIVSLRKDSFSGLRDLVSVNLSNNKISEVSVETLTSLPNLKHVNVSYNNLVVLPEELWVFLKDKETDIQGNPWDCAKNKPYTDQICQTKDSAKWWKPYLPQNSSKVIQNEVICTKCVCDTRTTYVAVNCSGRTMERLPSGLPNGTSAVILNHNRIESLTLPTSFAQEWSSVMRLYLRNNSVRSFLELEGTNLLTNLRVLDLRENKVTEIPTYILEQMVKLSDVYLGDNPWKCDCENAVGFQKWLFNHMTIVKDIDRIRCGPDSGLLENQILSHISKAELCPPPPEPIHYLDVLNILMAIVILLMVLKLGYDYWGQKRTGKLPQFFKVQVW